MALYERNNLKYIYVFFGIAFMVLTAMQIHNIRSHPFTKGFDNQGHLDYINLVKNEKKGIFHKISEEGKVVNCRQVNARRFIEIS